MKVWRLVVTIVMLGLVIPAAHRRPLRRPWRVFPLWPWVNSWRA
jgi:hypothetical protein